MGLGRKCDLFTREKIKTYTKLYDIYTYIANLNVWCLASLSRQEQKRKRNKNNIWPFHAIHNNISNCIQSRKLFIILRDSCSYILLVVAWSHKMIRKKKILSLVVWYIYRYEMVSRISKLLATKSSLLSYKKIILYTSTKYECSINLLRHLKMRTMTSPSSNCERYYHWKNISWFQRWIQRITECTVDIICIYKYIN